MCQYYLNPKSYVLDISILRCSIMLGTKKGATHRVVYFCAGGYSTSPTIRSTDMRAPRHPLSHLPSYVDEGFDRSSLVLLPNIKIKLPFVPCLFVTASTILGGEIRGAYQHMFIW